MKNRKQTPSGSRTPNPGRSDRKAGGEKKSFAKGGSFKPRTSSGSFKKNRSEQNDERGEKRSPAKRVYKTDSGFGKGPGKSPRFAGRNERSESGSTERSYRDGGEKRPPAKRAYKTDSGFRKGPGKPPQFAGKNERSYRDGEE